MKLLKINHLKKQGKLIKVLIIFIVLLYIIYLIVLEYIENERIRIEQEDLVRQGYCLKTKTILTKQELYRNAMRDFLREAIREKNKLRWEFESVYRNREQDIWLSEPLNGDALRTWLQPVYQNEKYSHQKAEMFHNMLKDRLVVLKDADSIDSEQFLPKNNGFNIYWNVLPPHFIYAYDCCTVYTKEEAIKRIRFLEEKKIHRYSDSSNDNKRLKDPNAYRYFYFDMMFANFKEDIIENNAYGSSGIFIPIDTCGEWTASFWKDEE